MTLLDLCEPLFLFACKVNRSKRKGGPGFEPPQLRAEVERILREMALAAYVDRDLQSQFTQVKPILIYFVDAIAEQAFPGRGQKMAKPDENPGEEFFVQLDKTLADNSRPALHRLTIFYTCLGLGFVGKYKDDSHGLTDKINQVAGRIQEFMELDEKKRLCSAAYEHTDERNLEPPVGRSLTGVGIVLAGLIVIVFFANAMLYRQRTLGLRNMVEHFNAVVGGTPSAVAATDK